MSGLRDLIADDVQKIFLNVDDFAKTHNINGVDMPIQIDTLEQIRREPHRDVHVDGVYVKALLIYVKETDFGPLPAVGRILTLDGKVYVITDAVDEDGMLSISLEAKKTAAP